MQQQGDKMQILKDNKILQDFFNKLEKSKTGVLLLDYDGTLAPFNVDRNKAFPYPGVIDKLNTLIKCQSVQIVIISGRAINDLLPLLKGLSPLPEIWGSHGLERFTMEGGYKTIQVDPLILQGLSIAKNNILKHVPKEQCEIKPFSVAVHWRQMSDKQKKDLLDTTQKDWKPLRFNYKLEICEFDGGLELRPQWHTKGDVIRSIMDELPNNTPIAYLGDDATDEDAFKAIGSKGLKILVRKEYRETDADVQIMPPEELLGFLDHWISCFQNAETR